MDKKTGTSGWMLSSNVVFALALMVGLFTVTSVQAATRWTGDGDEINWDDADNWDASVPGSGDDAAILLKSASVSSASTRDVFDLDVSGAEDTNKSWSGPTSLDIDSETLSVNGTGDSDFRIAGPWIDKGWGDSSAPGVDAEINVNDGGTLDLGNSSDTVIGQTDYAKGTLNINSGGQLTGDTGLNIGSTYDDAFGTGELNVNSGGKVDYSANMTLGRRGSGVGTVNISGDFSSTGVLSEHRGGSGNAITVNGSWNAFDDPGSDGSITVNGNFEMREGTLGFRFDDGGITPINVTGTGNYFAFSDDFTGTTVKIDPGMLDGDVYGTWTVATWEGEDMLAERDSSWDYNDMFSLYDDGDGHMTMQDIMDADGPVAWATTGEGVDTSVWSADFYKDTENGGGYMTVTAVPEPSTLALLGLAGLLLLKRRRRRA